MNVLNQSITNYRYRSSFQSSEFTDSMDELALDLTSALQRFKESQDLKIEFRCSSKGLFGFVISRESEANTVSKEPTTVLLHSTNCGKGTI